MCFECGDKWNLAHKCATTVALNLVEELWQLLPEDVISQSEPDKLSSDSDEDLMELSLFAVQGIDCHKTIRLAGTLDQHSVVFLVDSGNTSSFISHTLASCLPNWTPLLDPVQIRVANGTLLQCTHELVNCPVIIQGHNFVVNLKILPLQCYDIIFGMDWLGQHSPMEIHWRNKWLSFNHTGQKISIDWIAAQSATTPHYYYI